MCCSQGFLKTILGFFTFITTAVGFAGIVFGTIDLINANKVDMPDWNVQQISAIFLLCFGGVIFLIGIMGIIGASKKNRCCLYMFSVSVFPLFLIALAAAGVATYAQILASDMKDTQSKIDQCDWQTETCDGCGNNGALKFIKEANSYIYEINNEYFGRTTDCKALVSSKSKAGFIEEGFVEDYLVDEDADDTDGAYSNFMDCPQAKGDVASWGAFVAYFESEFECQGLCASTQFYSLYDSTKAVTTQKACYSKIVDFFSSTTTLIVCWSVFAFFLLNLVLTLCLCCHKDRKYKNQGENLYTRMNYYE